MFRFKSVLESKSLYFFEAVEFSFILGFTVLFNPSDAFGVNK